MKDDLDQLICIQNNKCYICGLEMDHRTANQQVHLKGLEWVGMEASACHARSYSAKI